MGGERETVLEKAPAVEGPSTSGSVRGIGGTIRIHQSGGEIHFHDDAAKIKAAVPVADWWKAWESLKNKEATWDFIDSKNESLLRVRTTISPPNFDSEITLVKALCGTNFRELNNFTKRK